MCVSKKASSLNMTNDLMSLVKFLSEKKRKEIASNNNKKFSFMICWLSVNSLIKFTLGFVKSLIGLLKEISAEPTRIVDSQIPDLLIIPNSISNGKIIATDRILKKS